MELQLPPESIRCARVRGELVVLLGMRSGNVHCFSPSEGETVNALGGPLLLVAESVRAMYGRRLANSVCEEVGRVCAVLCAIIVPCLCRF